MKKIFGIATLLLTALLAAESGGFHIWSGADLKGYEKKLAPKINAQKIANEPLAKFSNHSISVIHREGSGEAELHEKQADVIVVESGEATLIVGGTMPGSKASAPGEVRAASIDGGERKKLTPGALVHIPAKMPHQMLLDSGKQVTYAIVKIDSE